MPRHARRQRHPDRCGSIDAIEATDAFHDVGASSCAAHEGLTRTSELVGRIDTSISQLEQHQQEIAAAWNRYQERFEGIDHSLAKVFNQLDEGLSGYCNQVKDFAKELDRTTAKATEHLAGAIAELKESIDIEDQRQSRNLTSAGRSR